MRSVTIKLLSAFGSIALTTGMVGLSDPAVASTPATTHELRLAYDQADLGTAEGRAALRQRIEDAGAAVCPADEASPIAVARCRADAVAAAKRALFDQLLASR